MLSELISGEKLDRTIGDLLHNIHVDGPINPATFEALAYIKKFHPEILAKYEARLICIMGLFYKTDDPGSVVEAVYASYSQAIKDQFGSTYTPLQASAAKGVGDHKYFSFSAPTSAGKSFLLRKIIEKCKNDVVVIVPSRALISEYYYELVKNLDKSVLILQFVEDVMRATAKKRIFILTPERATELFKYVKRFEVDLILMDEAQIAEEELRGVRFDAFVRRSDILFPRAKKVFAHPFVKNPEAQLEKHGFEKSAAYENYDLHAVGKIFLSHKSGAFSYFSPYRRETAHIASDQNIVKDALKSGDTVLIYVSKASIYSRKFTLEFAEYIELCPLVEDLDALEIIEALRAYVGASKEVGERQSNFINMMERGIVVHHGSMPLKARLLIEQFIRGNYAHICFATSTLNQGINMPFDIVWIYNFRKIDVLTLKNLIGRAGRTSRKESFFDYGLTIVNHRNVNKFIDLMGSTVSISDLSRLDLKESEANDDLVDIIKSIKENSFNDELNLPQSQINRMSNANIDGDIELILDNLILNGKILSGSKYYQLSHIVRNGIKVAFKNVYKCHLKRADLTCAEASVLSAAIPMMLWRIQGKSFSEIVSLRYAYLSKRDEQRLIRKKIKVGDISKVEGLRRLADLKINWSPVAFSIPQKSPELCSNRTKLFLVLVPKLPQFSIGVLLWRNRMLSQA